MSLSRRFYECFLGQAVSIILDLLGLLPADILADEGLAIVRPLSELLPGQIWTGQDRLLEALAAITSKFKDRLDLSAFESHLVTCVAEDEFSRERNELVSPQASKKARLSFRGIVQLLLHEAQRGSSQYRLSAAVALSSLPWFYVKTFAPLIIGDFSDDFLRCLNIDAVHSDAASSLAASPLSTSDSSRYQPRSAHEMFGSRYNIHLTKKSKVSRPLNEEQKSPMILVMGGEEVVATDHDLLVMNVEGMVVNEEATKHSRATPERSYIPEPAYRIKLLECVAKGWPGLIDACQPSAESMSSLLSLRSMLSEWCFKVLEVEIWSLRRAALVVLSAFFSVNYFEEDLGRLLSGISSALGDAKHMHLRKAALNCLKTLLEKLKRESLLEHKAEIKKIILSGRADKQPEVLEVASEVQSVYNQVLL